MVAQTVKKKKKPACNVGDLGSILGWEDLLEKGMATTPVLLLENSMDTGVEWATVLWVTVSQIQLSD